MVACPRPFPVVVTTNSGYPLDQNLYQTVKGMSAAAQVVSEGGYIAAAARCNDGFPAHGNFKKLLFDHASPRALLDTIEAPGLLDVRPVGGAAPRPHPPEGSGRPSRARSRATT